MLIASTLCIAIPFAPQFIPGPSHWLLLTLPIIPLISMELGRRATVWFPKSIGSGRFVDANALRRLGRMKSEPANDA
jgi:hypothetical protein